MPSKVTKGHGFPPHVTAIFWLRDWHGLKADILCTQNAVMLMQIRKTSYTLQNVQLLIIRCLMMEGRHSGPYKKLHRCEIQRYISCVALHHHQKLLPPMGACQLCEPSAVTSPLDVAAGKGSPWASTLIFQSQAKFNLSSLACKMSKTWMYLGSWRKPP